MTRSGGALSSSSRSRSKKAEAPGGSAVDAVAVPSAARMSTGARPRRMGGWQQPLDRAKLRERRRRRRRAAAGQRARRLVPLAVAAAAAEVALIRVERLRPSGRRVEQRGAQRVPSSGRGVHLDCVRAVTPIANRRRLAPVVAHRRHRADAAPYGRRAVATVADAPHLPPIAARQLTVAVRVASVDDGDGGGRADDDRRRGGRSALAAALVRPGRTATLAGGATRHVEQCREQVSADAPTRSPEYDPSPFSSSVHETYDGCPPSAGAVSPAACRAAARSRRRRRRSAAEGVVSNELHRHRLARRRAAEAGRAPPCGRRAVGGHDADGQRDRIEEGGAAAADAEHVLAGGDREPNRVRAVAGSSMLSDATAARRPPPPPTPPGPTCRHRRAAAAAARRCRRRRPPRLAQPWRRGAAYRTTAASRASTIAATASGERGGVERGVRGVTLAAPSSAAACAAASSVARPRRRPRFAAARAPSALVARLQHDRPRAGDDRRQPASLAPRHPHEAARHHAERRAAHVLVAAVWRAGPGKVVAAHRAVLASYEPSPRRMAASTDGPRSCARTAGRARTSARGRSTPEGSTLVSTPWATTPRRARKICAPRWRAPKA